MSLEDDDLVFIQRPTDYGEVFFAEVLEIRSADFGAEVYVGAFGVRKGMDGDVGFDGHGFYRSMRWQKLDQEGSECFNLYLTVESEGRAERLIG